VLLILFERLKNHDFPITVNEFYIKTISFTELSLFLQDYGHRVRLATHADFDTFVKSAGVDFYPLGGDPRALARCKRFLFNAALSI